MPRIFRSAITYGHFSYSDREVDAFYAHLRDCARRKRIIHYDDSCAIVQPYGLYHGPRDQRLWYLLGYISEQEVKAGREDPPQADFGWRFGHRQNASI